MIIGAIFSYDGSFVTMPCAETLVIRAVVLGLPIERTIDLVELPAFIEYMENNSMFYIDGGIKVELNDIQRRYFVESLKRDLERMEGYE